MPRWRLIRRAEPDRVTGILDGRVAEVEESRDFRIQNSTGPKLVFGVLSGSFFTCDPRPHTFSRRHILRGTHGSPA